MAATPPPPSSEGNFFEDLMGGAQDVVGGITGTVGFWSDPFGSMYRAGRDAVESLATDFIPAVTGATLPDLTLPAFIDTYRVSFAISLFVAVVLLVVQLLRTARGSQSGRDTFQAIGVYFPGFILGMMFGPLVGMLIVNFIRSLTEAVIGWAYAGTAEGFASQLGSLLLENPSNFAGGVAIAWMLSWAMAIGMLLIAILFAVQLVTLYFMGALAPLATVWLLDPTRRGTATKYLTFWVGLLFTHPVLFLLLGLAFRLIISPLSAWGSDGWKNLVAIVVAILAMYAAAFSPFFLMKFVKTLTDGAPASGPTSSQSKPIGPHAPGRMPQASQPTPAPVPGSPATSQMVRGASAPPGPTLRQAAATKTAAQGSGQVITAGAGGAARAGVKVSGGAATAVAATSVSAVRKGVKEAERAADTSIAPPPRESYGKDRL